MSDILFETENYMLSHRIAGIIKLIGYIDSVLNGVTDAYIQDLMAHPAYQSIGIETEFMNRMIAYLKERKIYMISVVFEENCGRFIGTLACFQCFVVKCRRMKWIEI